MPHQRRCPESGALIFELTDDEKAAKQAAEDIERIKQENIELRQRIERLESLADANKAGDN